MRNLLFMLFALPLLAHAGSSAKPPPPEEPCEFSKKVDEHNTIEYVDKSKCNKKICNHVLVCGSYAWVVNCPAKNGRCDGYSANECREKATMKVDEKFGTQAIN